VGKCREGKHGEDQSARNSENQDDGRSDNEEMSRAEPPWTQAKGPLQPIHIKSSLSSHLQRGSTTRCA
jgi:hypothetical protein